jgi:hypothetical protein
MATLLYKGLTGTAGAITVNLTTDTFASVIAAIAAIEALNISYYDVSVERAPNINSVDLPDSTVLAGAGIITGDGTNTDFTLPGAFTTDLMMISINGVLQQPTVAYNVSGSTLTFTEAPDGGDIIDIRSVASATVNDFSGDGSTTAFTLSQSSSTNLVIVSVNGIVQQPASAYNVSGSTLTFTEAPFPDDIIDARIVSTASVDALVGDGVTTIFSLSQSSTTPGAVVLVNGVVQNPVTAYTVSDTTLTFTEAPDSGDDIDVRLGFITTQDSSSSGASVADGDKMICIAKQNGLTKAQRQVQKLDIAQSKRQNDPGGNDPNVPYYRDANVYDITLLPLPEGYSDGSTVNPLQPGRPWITP